jgi:hypothetical protein
MTFPEWWTWADTALLVVLIVFGLAAIIITVWTDRASDRARRRLDEARKNWDPDGEV